MTGLRVQDAYGGAVALQVISRGVIIALQVGARPDVILGAADLRHLADCATIAAAELDRAARFAP
jgi:hypothetical protein